MNVLTWMFVAGVLVGGGAVTLGGFIYQAIVRQHRGTHRARDLDINY